MDIGSLRGVELREFVLISKRDLLHYIVLF
jgi:hypothetical protein